MEAKYKNSELCDLTNMNNALYLAREALEANPVFSEVEFEEYRLMKEDEVPQALVKEAVALLSSLVANAKDTNFRNGDNAERAMQVALRGMVANGSIERWVPSGRVLRVRLDDYMICDKK